MKKIVLAVSVLILFFSACNNLPVEPVALLKPVPFDSLPSPEIEPVYPVPPGTIQDWQESELVMFIHFGMNTFVDSGFGTGGEPPTQFDPPSINVKQWVSVAKEAGFKYLILTAKHHDGFCLWPSKYTDYTIARSNYKGGNGDVVKEFADECHAQGVKFGFYLSIWDMNAPTYGTPAYNDYYVNQMIELCTGYGEVGEIWLDGFLGYDPVITHPQFDWLRFAQVSKIYQPRSLMAIMGPDIRWVGNEDGLGSETDWSFTWTHMSHHGIGNVLVWWPTECDVSIRPSWFYLPHQDPQVKTAEHLVELYMKSVGRNSNLLLNVPPMRNGNFNDIDMNSLRGFRTILNEMFRVDLFKGARVTATNTRSNDTLWSASRVTDGNKETFWVPEKEITKATLTVEPEKPVMVNIFRLEEAIKYGQRVSSFDIEGLVNGVWQKLTGGTTIGRSRILKLDSPVEVEKVRLVIKDARGAPAIRTFSAFYSIK